ncbi:hypothetical protein JCM8547_004002 [Rhodosporidiobolus lusitaniae]
MATRGLSKEAKAVLVEGYKNPHLLPAGRTLHQRLVEYVFARGAHGRGLSEAAKAELREAYNNRAQLDLPAVGFSFWDALAAYVQARVPSDPPITGSQVQNAIGYMRRHNQLGITPAQVVLQHQGMIFSGQDHALVPNNEVHYDEPRHLYLDSQGQTVTPHWIDDEGANGRGLSDAAKIELREAFNNRAQLGFPAAGRAFWNALAAHVQARAPSDPPITGSQVENAVGYMRRNNQLGMPPVQLAHEGSPDPYEPVAAPDGEERPIVLQHQDIMFSGADHGVVPNDQVIYDPQTHEYVDLHGRTVTPHWLDGEFF